MPFFENLGKKVGEAAQSAAKKSNEFIEINKLNSNINSEEEIIKKIFEQIGRIVYENFCLNPDKAVDCKELCQQIKDHEDIIKNFELKVHQIKNLKICPECKCEVSNTKAFCPKCGAKLKLEDIPEQNQESVVCSECGAEFQKGSAFCGSCGHKVQQ